jgi:hypothetical protein
MIKDGNQRTGLVYMLKTLTPILEKSRGHGGTPQVRMQNYRCMLRATGHTVRPALPRATRRREMRGNRREEQDATHGAERARQLLLSSAAIRAVAAEGSEELTGGALLLLLRPFSPTDQ